MNTVFKKSFLKSVEKIRDKSLKDEIVFAIENVENSSNIKEIKGLKKIKGYKDYFRIKIDKYRIGLRITDDVVYFVDIDHRKDIYKYFP